MTIQKRDDLNFESTVKEKFSFLLDFGFVIIESLPTIVCYRKGEILVDVYHGRQSYELGVGIAYREVRYALSEFIRISDPEIAKKYRNPAVTTQKALEESLTKVADVVKRYCAEALQGDQEVFSKFDFQRKLWGKQYELEVLAQQLRPKAHEAFRLGKYREAAELYKQIQPLLTPAEIKKLATAEERGK